MRAPRAPGSPAELGEAAVPSHFAAVSTNAAGHGCLRRQS